MRRQTFNELIENSQFRELFIMEMGWNNVHGNAQLPAYVIDEKEICITAIAERNGFQVLKCEVGDIPSSSFCKKLDLKLRKQAESYILIFFQPHSLHHLWVAPVKKTEKRDLVFVEYETLNQADFLFSKIDGLTFDVDESTTIIDVKERIQTAFVVNSEKLTKVFYQGFRKQHSAFVKFISGIDDEIEEKSNGNKRWYASIMLNRLMFCYFIQKKGFLDNNTNYLRDKLAWVRREQGEDRFFQTFYRGFLTQLFHGGLNDPHHSREFENTYGRIPYLNGGMFDEHTLEQQYDNIDIADEAFESLFAFFDQWHWHLDDRHTATGKDINPDVLGYIFEQYINDRAAMGAYYTKEDITEYVGKNCILPFLMDKVRTATKDSEKYFRPNGYVWQTLAQSGDRYIYDAMKRGFTEDWQEQIPDYVALGLDTSEPNLVERRTRWNERTSEYFALPTEIWRETVERLQRCSSLLEKIYAGEITEINDFITYNLDIRLFVYDLLLNADDHRFVSHFYHAMQGITILDPTCGSGAFLFAAMNILEPLYEVCIERMEQWHEENPNLFKDELEEIHRKYRSNRQYFIYKSIILRNLYGVDIMAEATEIAKLRLFLKMVAVVDVNLREPNLGLDPLPDIDFNIRCGNTLVGYATESELERDLIWGDMFANQEFREKVEEGMDKAARAFSVFKQVQFRQDEDMVAFKQAKQDLRERLTVLNDALNHRLFVSSGDGVAEHFEDWKHTHQPFHWLAEFYEIIQGNGGFDVIIGNPPYVVYTDNKSPYKIGNSYKTRECANLYAFCIERSHAILHPRSKFGMIVPNSSISASKMQPLQKIVTKDSFTWVSNYSWRPSKLFEGADMLLAIIMKSLSSQEKTLSTVYHKWYNEFRPYLFSCLKYTDVSNIKIEGSIPKMPSEFVVNILDKMRVKSHNHKLSECFKDSAQYKLYYFRAVQYWFKVLDREPIFEEDGIHKVTGEMKPISFYTNEERYAMISILSSSLFFLNYIIWSSCQVVNSRDFNLDMDISSLDITMLKELAMLGIKLESDYQKHSHIKERNYSKKGRVFTMQKQHFFIKFSKSVIDEIDNQLANYYNLTKEELDFIINYDIKYRMGDELNEE